MMIDAAGSQKATDAGKTYAACDGIRISALSGAVRIDAPDLFSAEGRSCLAEVAERLLGVASVDALEIDRSAGAIRVNYLASRLPLSEVLSQFAEALSATPPDVDRTLSSELGRQLLAGVVTRVERRRPQGRTRLEAAAARLRGALGRITPRGDANRKRPVADVVEIVILSEFVVHCAAVSPSVSEAPTQLLMGDARRLDIAAGGRGPADGRSHQADTHRRVVPATGLRRLANLSAAGGCFVMSIIGLITPGIPTVPFVLATSYFLVRSSPALDARLKRSKLFGQMVRDWQAYGGMRPGTKWKIVWLTVGIMGVTILIAGPSPTLLLVVGCMGTLGTTLILRLPTVPEDAPDDVSSFVLPAPA